MHTRIESCKQQMASTHKGMDQPARLCALYSLRLQRAQRCDSPIGVSAWGINQATGANNDPDGKLRAASQAGKQRAMGSTCLGTRFLNALPCGVLTGRAANSVVVALLAIHARSQPTCLVCDSHACATRTAAKPAYEA